MPASRRKKKSLLINPKFQLSVIKYFAALFVITSAVNISAIVFFFNEFKQKGLNAGLSADHIFFTFISEQESSMYALMGGALFLALCALIVGGFYLSHKVAGPLYRLKEHLKAHNEGSTELKVVKFRKGDYFLEIQDEFNKMVTKKSYNEITSSDEDAA